MFVCSTASPWGKCRTISIKNELIGDAEKLIVGYRTKFILYLSTSNYYIHKLGESEYDGDDTFYSVIKFKRPKDLGILLSNDGNSNLRASKPVIELIELASTSKYLDEDEKQEWKKLLIAKE